MPKQAKPHERAILALRLILGSNKQVQHYLGYRSHTSVSEATARYEAYLCRHADIKDK